MLRLDELQVLSFRLRRSHLSGRGAPTLADAAAANLGAQAQQEGPAGYGLSLRTAGRPSAEDVRRARLEEPRTIVRTWGQRDTVHLYDVRDWAAVIAARPAWPLTGRLGPQPEAEEFDPDGDGSYAGCPSFR